MSRASLDGTLRALADAADVLCADSAATRPRGDDVETFMRHLCTAAGQVYGETRLAGHGLSGFSSGVYHPFFNSSGPPDSVQVTTAADAALVPVRDPADESFYTGLLERVVLYAEPVALVLPETVNWVATSYSGAGHGSNPAQAMRIAGHVHRHGRAVRAGNLAVLPTAFDRVYETSIDSEHWFARAPLLQRAEDTQPLPLISAGWDADRSMFVYQQVVLPFFPGVSVSDLAEIARAETDAFTLFAGFLRRRIQELATSPESGMSDLRDEIDQEVARLRIEARKLSRLRVLRGAELGLFTVSLAAAVATDVGVLETAAGVVGSVALLDVLKEHTAARREALDLRASEFYVPMVLAERSAAATARS